MEQVFQDLVTLIGFSEEDGRILKETSDVTSQWVEELSQAFYDLLFSYEPTAKVFYEGERAMREVSLKQWYLDVVSGNFTPEFWKHQWLVGLVHVARGVTNPYMLGMTSRVQQLFLHKCLEAFEPAQAEAVYGAFKRATDVVAGLVTEGYLQSYMTAMEKVAGFRRALVDRMLQMEIFRMLNEAGVQLSVKPPSEE
ncbi:MAG: globin [Chloroflexi bacterium]|nr:globin [Chloroflexota bacterium]